jgi:hypothetical protein
MPEQRLHHVGQVEHPLQVVGAARIVECRRQPRLPDGVRPAASPVPRPVLRPAMTRVGTTFGFSPEYWRLLRLGRGIDQLQGMRHLQFDQQPVHQEAGGARGVVQGGVHG